MLTSDNQTIRDKVTDFETQSRRLNIKVVGLAEREEGDDPGKFFDGFIRNLLGADHFSDPIAVERCYRLGPRGVAARPPILVARLHNHQQKERILLLARQQFPLSYKGRQIYVFPDLPPDIMKRRQRFSEIRKKFQDAGIRTGFIYPARLRITHKNKTSTFNSPEDAEKFAATMVPPVGGGTPPGGSRMIAQTAGSG